MESGPQDHATIIIVKRKAHSDHSHHGGAWKIAYADFVTAMMAFFLVMWLINAANEKTRAQVASYFNPIKLTDSSTAKKGISNPRDRTPVPDDKKTPPTENPESHKLKLEENKPVDAQGGRYTDEQLFRNPYGILGLLAGEALNDITGHAEKGLAIVDPTVQGDKDGKYFRDPFDPYAWRKPSPPKPVENPVETSDAVKIANEIKKLEVKVEDGAEAKVEVKSEAPNLISTKVETENSNIAKLPVAEKPESLAPQLANNTKIENTKLSEEDSKNTADAKDAVLLQQRITKVLEGFPTDEEPTLEVKKTSEGILISLTDSLTFDMFGLGSAQPKPTLVLMMEKIADVIKDYNGTLVIRGHTDSRPYRNGGGDNWRLSSSRAQMAYYMLVRAGVDEKKVERIEGYADHKLKFPDQPEKSGNRRIELLLKAVEK